MDCDLSYWSEAVSSVPDREMGFVYNTAIDTIPTISNLALWYNGQVCPVQALWLPHTDTGGFVTA